MVVLRSAAEIGRMREAGRIVARTLEVVRGGRTRASALKILTALAAESPRAGAKPSFLGYHPTWAPRPYPGCCACRSTTRSCTASPITGVLEAGDMLSIDCGADWTGCTATRR